MNMDMNNVKSFSEVYAMIGEMKKDSGYDKGYKAGYEKGLKEGEKKATVLINQLREENNKLRMELSLNEDEENMDTEEVLDLLIDISEEITAYLHKMKDAEVD